MRGVDDRQDGMFSYVSLDARVPKEHPLRPIRALVDEALGALTKDYLRETVPKASADHKMQVTNRQNASLPISGHA